LIRFKKNQNALVKKYTTEAIVRLDNFFKEVDPLIVRQEEYHKTNAPDYNLFLILKIQHLETRVHTPFLRHLLSPDETHAQGRLFFDYFMQQILGDSYGPESISNIKVRAESRMSEGQLDLLVEFKRNKIPFGMVIENKIYALDGDQQLERYHRFLTNDRRYQDGNYHLVYLCPRQRRPSSQSINQNLYEELKKKRALTELGYHEHIAPWLYHLLKQIDAPKLITILQQYIKTIQSL
jgi:hypothetical protein